MANLAQLKVLESLDGFIPVSKPSGIPFSGVVKAVKRHFNLVKLGHGGSLDAMASGLMVLLLNDANRYAGDLMGADRTWKGTMRLGVATDTHDIHGRQIAETSVSADSVSREAMDRAVREFSGDIFQTESRFSSIVKDGSASYEIADTGEHSPFLAHVYRLDVCNPRPEDGAVKIDFTLEATKGVIVRTLVNDFGEALGCHACLEKLERTRIGRFSIDEAVGFPDLFALALGDLPRLVEPLSRMLR